MTLGATWLLSSEPIFGMNVQNCMGNVFQNAMVNWIVALDFLTERGFRLRDLVVTTVLSALSTVGSRGFTVLTTKL